LPDKIKRIWRYTNTAFSCLMSNCALIHICYDYPK